jgi:hypothetical protein
MGYARVTLADLRTQLADLLGTQGNFWTQEEQDSAINEAIAAWQLMTGETVTTVSQVITSTTLNKFDVTTTDSAGTVLSVIRATINNNIQTSKLRELSIVELDQGYYGWRSETSSTTTQLPSYWVPIGITSVMLYPRVGTTSTLYLDCYADALPLTATNSYIDIDESYLTRVLAYAQSLLAFKQGVGDGTDNAKPLRELFMAVARDRNTLLLETALYKNYMGQDDSKGEPGDAQPQQGARG